jgi:hypothetical protein
VTRRTPAAAVVALVATLLASCATGTGDTVDAAVEEPTASSSAEAGHHGDEVLQESPPVPLRKGERRWTVEMPKPYTPSAPAEVGTDDYRCFLLDPEVDEDVMVTGTNVSPGNPEVVHHVILFRVPPEQVAVARQKDEETEGQGWTCFGGTDLDAGVNLDAAPWLGAWAPGGGERVMRSGYGVPLTAGSQIVMQVHYNLLAGTEPDVSATELRVADGSAPLEPVSTMLLPAPVELPCRPDHNDDPLCDRAASLADVKERFGDDAGSTAERLHLICPSSFPGSEQSCTRTFYEPATIIGAAGHMHLLGRSIRIEVNPDTAEAQTILDVAVWDFDNQGANPVEPLKVERGDEVRVTCEHDQSLRDLLPAFEGQPDRYVLWGEGTTDEMCLGILQIAR